jgi:hypothetical protein
MCIYGLYLWLYCIVHTRMTDAHDLAVQVNVWSPYHRRIPKTIIDIMPSQPEASLGATPPALAAPCMSVCLLDERVAKCVAYPQ